MLDEDGETTIDKTPGRTATTRPDRHLTGKNFHISTYRHQQVVVV